MDLKRAFYHYNPLTVSHQASELKGLQKVVRGRNPPQLNYIFFFSSVIHMDIFTHGHSPHYQVVKNVITKLLQPPLEQ